MTFWKTVGAVLTANLIWTSITVAVYGGILLSLSK